MQPTTIQQITVSGGIQGKVTSMTVSEEDMPHIMNVLTRQYSDSAMAVLREYSANARDEHVITGQVRPIEVTLPNKFSSNLIIKDWGRGMSTAFVEDRYSRYGHSDKRATATDPGDKAVGGFGIGGKAALSYTDTFTLTTVKNGVKSSFVFSRNKLGAGSVKTIFVAQTDEPNSTEIKVPANNLDDFTTKADHLFKFWPEGTVLVNGEAPRLHMGLVIADNLWYSEGSGQSYIVMGGIPYRVATPTNYFNNHSMARFNFIADVPINSCDVTPAREDLEYTPKTIATLRAVCDTFESAFIAAIQKEVDSMPTAPEAFDNWRIWLSRMPQGLAGIKYKGNLIEPSVPMSGIYWRRNASRYSKNNHKVARIDVVDARTAIFVTGRVDSSSYTKTRLRDWLKATNKNNAFSIVYFTETLPESEFIGNINTATWQDVLAVKPKAPARPTGMFQVADSQGYFEDISKDELLEMDTKFVLVTPQDIKCMNWSHAVRSLTNLGADVTLVKLPVVRWSKFRTEFSNAENFDSWVGDFIRHKMNKVSESTWQYRGLGSTSRWILRNIPKDNLDDPKLKELSVLSSSPTEDALIEKCKLVSSYIGKGSIFSDKAGSDWILSAYPLLPHVYTNSGQKFTDEITIYLNAAYAARKDTNAV